MPLPAAQIDAAIGQEIADGHVAGAVVLVGDAEHIYYRAARGWRVLGDAPEPIRTDTIFDLASVTKAVATATAIMQLAEQGRLALDAPASRYWPGFGQRGKAAVTVRQLLAHTSGLPAGVSSARALRSGASVLADIEAMALLDEPATRVRYSDINYVVLGELVRRASGLPLDVWCAAHIFTPLGMVDTMFRPGRDLAPRLAPTVPRAGHHPESAVHDPIAAALGGVAGNAGLFGTADDLARFAQMLLREGQGIGTRILRPDSVSALSVPATPPPAAGARGWRSAGWALQAPLAANRFRMPWQAGMLEHLGYTGTGLWVDLITKRFVVILSSRLYPGGKGDAAPLRAQVLGAVASTMPPLSAQEIMERAPVMAAIVAAGVRPPPATGPVRSGIDVLASRGFAPVAGKRVALVTNRSGFDSHGARTVDLLAQAPGTRLVAILVPEHGLDNDVDAPFGDTVDASTGVAVRSLYGSRQRISPELLADVDMLVFDIQDAGVRFFTYLATLGYALEASASAHIPLVVLDRPNPLGADIFGGPVLDADATSFTGYYPLPLVHGMTIGELARLFNDRLGIGADLLVVPMAQYRRAMKYGDTGLGWVPISPNLRDAEALSLYADVGMVEGAEVSVGRGTAMPFRVIGAPWIDAQALARELNALDTGATFQPTRFVPAEGPHRGTLCAGVTIQRSPGPVRPGRIGLAVAQVLHRRYPTHFRIETIQASVGSRKVGSLLRDGSSLDAIDAAIDAQTAAFAIQRQPYLMY